MTWTPATSMDLKGKTPVEYRALIDQALDIIIDRLPVLENELVDTRQRGLGFMTPDAKAAADEQLRRERAARYPSTTAQGAPIPVGLRGFVRAQAVASMPGERPVPVNLAAVSLAGEIPLTLLHLNQRIRRQLAAAGVCHISRPLDHPDDTKAIADETRTLTRVIASKKLLLEVLRAVEDLAQRAKDHVDGNDRVPHHRPCPHCGRRTLVVYLDEGRIVCERDPRTGQYEDCVCADSYCGCKVRHHRHEWLRNTNASRTTSWQGLNRAQDLAEREANQKDTQDHEGAPMPDPTDDARQVQTYDPATLDGFQSHNGIKAASIGEDGDVVILGHHDDDTTWAVLQAQRSWEGGEDDLEEIRATHDLKRGHATFSNHSEGCERLNCLCDDDVCDKCKATLHTDCEGPCLCAEDYDHDAPAAWPCSCECDCDEYGWWVAETKTGEPVTWVTWSYEKSKARRVPTEPGMTAVHEPARNDQCDGDVDYLQGAQS